MEAPIASEAWAASCGISSEGGSTGPGAAAPQARPTAQPPQAVELASPGGGRDESMRRSLGHRAAPEDCPLRSAMKSQPHTKWSQTCLSLVVVVVVVVLWF